MLLFLGGIEVLAQVRVTGRVISAEDNEPLVGVTIQEKNTMNGTITDVEGNYSMSVTSDDADANDR